MSDVVFLYLSATQENDTIDIPHEHTSLFYLYVHTRTHTNVYVHARTSTKKHRHIYMTVTRIYVESWFCANLQKVEQANRFEIEAKLKLKCANKTLQGFMENNPQIFDKGTS